MFVNELRMTLLQNNPYRLLGVYANSPTKERLANHNRMKAFLKVGKSASFPLDLPQYLQPINRTETLVGESETKLKLPQDQMHYAQFWFLKMTPLDEVAFNHLIAGEMSKAEEIWQKKECASSLQNRIVCALMRDDYNQVMTCAEALYENVQYVNQFVSAVIGTVGSVDVENLPFAFLDSLCEETDANKMLLHITNSTWRKHISEKVVKPLIDKIQNAIDEAKKSRGKGSRARLNAGEVLVKGTQKTLSLLNDFLPISDLRYQMITDKLGLEILQCGIDYYNESDDVDAAHKAMKLQKYALKIVVGQMAKDRCKENVDILQEIIDNLPPSDVFAEDKAIHKELRKYCLLPDKICHAVTLLNNTKPHLQAIKCKLGATNDYYLKISTQIVGNALSNVIAEVNEAQSMFSVDKGEPNAALAAILRISHVKSVLEEAWKATRIMDGFDMEADYKAKRYNENRSTLKRLCEQLGVSTSTYTPRTSTPRTSQSEPTSTARPYSLTPNRGTINRQPTSADSHNSSKSSSSLNGCVVTLIAWSGLGCIIGAICEALGGDFSAGFCISGILVLIGSGKN